MRVARDAWLFGNINRSHLRRHAMIRTGTTGRQLLTAMTTAWPDEVILFPAGRAGRG
jgi:hypothetical protein